MRLNGQIATGCTVSTYGSLAALLNGVTQATLVSKVVDLALDQFETESIITVADLSRRWSRMRRRLNAILMSVNGSLRVFRRIRRSPQIERSSGCHFRQRALIPYVHYDQVSIWSMLREFSPMATNLSRRD